MEEAIEDSGGERDAPARLLCKGEWRWWWQLPDAALTAVLVKAMALLRMATGQLAGDVPSTLFVSLRRCSFMLGSKFYIGGTVVI